jgi:hypothetical protein
VCSPLKFGEKLKILNFLQIFFFLYKYQHTYFTNSLLCFILIKFFFYIILLKIKKERLMKKLMKNNKIFRITIFNKDK